MNSPPLIIRCGDSLNPVMSRANQFPFDCLAPIGHLLFRFTARQLESLAHQFGLRGAQLFYMSDRAVSPQTVNPPEAITISIVSPD